MMNNDDPLVNMSMDSSISGLRVMSFRFNGHHSAREREREGERERERGERNSGDVDERRMNPTMMMK